MELVLDGELRWSGSELRRDQQAGWGGAANNFPAPTFIRVFTQSSCILFAYSSSRLSAGDILPPRVK